MQRAAPTISIVVAVRDEQAWLEELAGSVLDQAYGDVELVAIDDASRNHVPEILAELARRDPRVSVHRLAEPGGAAAALERGLAEASGEYVWLVRPTDLLAPDSLAAVAERLAATSPDVLLLHHRRRGLLGNERDAPQRGLLERVSAGGDPWPALAGLAPQASSCVFRRAHLESLGTLDPAADGVAVAWPALLTAATVDALPAASYVRRTGIAAAERAAGGPGDLIAAYERVLAFAEARGDLPAARRSALAAALLRHELSVIGRSGGREARRLFGLVARSYSRAVALAGAPGGSSVARLRSRLVAHDRYLAFRALERARAARAGVGGVRGKLSRRRGRRRAAARKRELRRWYESRLREPIDPNLAVFAAFWYRGYSDNPRAIYEKARELVPGMRGVWIVTAEAEPAMPDGVERVIAGTREYYDVIARARYLVNNVNFPNDVVKREGSTHVMTHHGTPLKLMGLDERRSPLAKMDFAALMRRCARWDYSVSSNPHSTLVWERVYPTGYETLEVGYPRNDVLVSSGEEEVQRARAELGIAPGQTAVLYTPTHREHQRGYVPVLDVDAVADALGPDHVLLVRAHYFYRSARATTGPRGEGRVIDVAAHPSVEQLCLAADVLITDYSSIMFDYAVLDRPLVIHAPDWEVYRAIRGTYFDLMAEAPGVVTRTEADVVGAFRSGAVWGEEAARARAAFRARFCSLEDGHAAERVVRRVWFGEPVPAGSPATEATL